MHFLQAEIEKMQEDRNNEEEEETEDNEYDIPIEEETTTEKDIEDFLKSVKSSALKDIAKNTDSRIPSIVDLRERIIMLNRDQRKIFDDIGERMILPLNSKEQFCVYIAGAAGAGKSFLLQLVIDAVKYLTMQSGDEIEKPKILVMAPTANAASIVNGTRPEVSEVDPQK